MVRLKHYILLTARIYILLFCILCSTCAQAQESRVPLKGRVEAVESGADPSLPSDLLRGYAGAAESSLPPSLRGTWYGTVHISQMDTYPSLHPEPYCQAFISEVVQQFHVGQKGRIVLEIQPSESGNISLVSSDVRFSRGFGIQLTSGTGPALVPGGMNLPRTVKNEVVELGQDRIEQTRIDFVRIVDEMRRTIHTGFSEVTALYQLTGRRRIALKILSVDYDREGKPLWKSLMEGDASR